MARRKPVWDGVWRVRVRTALPTALVPTREPRGSRQVRGKPIKIADSEGLRQRTVTPARSHQTCGCEAVTQKEGC